MVHCGPHSHPDSGHQEMERGGVEVTESSQMMNIPFQLTYHEPEINFMLISNLREVKGGNVFFLGGGHAFT